MRRTFERGTTATLSFSGGPHAPVNIADNMENAGSWTISGSKVPKSFKDLRKLSERNIAQYSTGNGFFPPTFTSSILSAMFTGACGPPEKLSLALVSCLYVLRMIVKLVYTK